MACRASCVPLPLTHPDEHPWVSGCTALPTHPRSRSSSRQEGVGQSPPFSTLTAPIWFGESRVRGAKYLPRIWLSCSCCCGRGTPGGIGGTGLPICPWLHWLSHSCRVVSARATPGLEFPPGVEAPQGLGVVLLSGCQVVRLSLLFPACLLPSFFPWPRVGSGFPDQEYAGGCGSVPWRAVPR